MTPSFAFSTSDALTSTLIQSLIEQQVRRRTESLEGNIRELKELEV